MTGGVLIEKGLEDWQILQQNENGMGRAHISGTYVLTSDELLDHVTVSARILLEDTGEVILPWRNAVLSENYHWEVDFDDIPRGGLYRLETCMAVEGSDGNDHIPRGDLVLHFGVGDIFVIAGQSNASGRGRDPIYDPPELGVHALRNSGRWSIATHPLNETTGSIFDAHYEIINTGHSPALAFAKKLKRELGYPIGLLQTALGGKKISYWKPDGTGILYTEMVDMIKTYCPDGVKGVYWHQGCNDAAEFESDFYYDRFQEMVEHLRADLGDPDLPLLTVQMGRYTAAVARTEQSDYNWAVLREAQRRAAHQLPNIYIVPSNDLKLYDMIHNCSASNLILGERLASAALYELYGKGRHYKAPEPERIREVEPGKLEVVFSHVTHWLNPYEVPADELPLTVEDEQGVVAITEYACDKDTITLTLARPLAGRAALSGAHQTNPPALILCDCATLPMLSFYQMEIEK